MEYLKSSQSEHVQTRNFHLYKLFFHTESSSFKKCKIHPSRCSGQNSGVILKIPSSPQARNAFDCIFKIYPESYHFSLLPLLVSLLKLSSSLIWIIILDSQPVSLVLLCLDIMYSLDSNQNNLNVKLDHITSLIKIKVQCFTITVKATVSGP